MPRPRQDHPVHHSVNHLHFVELTNVADVMTWTPHEFDPDTATQAVKDRGGRLRIVTRSTGDETLALVTVEDPQSAGVFYASNEDGTLQLYGSVFDPYDVRRLYQGLEDTTAPGVHVVRVRVL